MSNAMKRAQVLPPVFFLIALLVMAVLHSIAPVVQMTSDPWRYLGLLPLFIGFGLIMVAAYYFKRAGTTVKPFEKSTVLVKKGPYRLTRNPMYLGLVLMLVGMAVLLGSLTPFLVIFLFAYMLKRNFILREEVQLRDSFGEEYAAYKRKVRRWM